MRLPTARREIVRRLGTRSLVLCPNSAVQAQWLRTAELFGARDGVAAPDPNAPIACLTYQSLSKANFQAAYTDAVSMMKDGHVQIFTLGTTAPASAVMDLASARDVKLVPVDDKTFNYIKNANSGHNKLVIKAGTYPKQDKDVPVIGYSTHLVVACDLPEQTVYGMVKAMASNVDAMAAVVKSIEGITPKDMALDIGVPFHNGATKFYKEAGAM